METPVVFLPVSMKGGWSEVLAFTLYLPLPCESTTSAGSPKLCLITAVFVTKCQECGFPLPIFICFLECLSCLPVSGEEVWVYALRRSANRNGKCMRVSAKSLFLLLLLTRLILVLVQVSVLICCSQESVLYSSVLFGYVCHLRYKME